MTKYNVTLFGGYAEENRKSMDVYASKLSSSMLLYPSKISWNIDIFRPDIAKGIILNKLNYGIKLKCSKYYFYPRTAKNHNGDINHIIDQSYSYLLNYIDSKRSVVTVHDIIPILGWKGIISGLSYPHYPLLFKLSIASLHKAKAIIAVSENTKKDLVQYCGISPEKISVIYNGINESFHTMPKEKKAILHRKFNFPDKAHIVLIMGYQQYKNHLTSFKVINKLQDILSDPVQLVWLGGTIGQCEQLSNKVKLNNPVTRLSNLSLKQLVELYNSVDCLLFPSWYEGFGWPPLEAMACGVPVVCSNAGPIPEIVMDAAITKDPEDIQGLFEAIKTVLIEKDQRNSYIKLGYNNIKRFTWKNCASEVDKLYQRVLI